MKKNTLSLVLTLVFGLSSLANPVDGEKKEVKTNESKVTWKAYKVTGSHTGTVNLKSGTLIFDDNGMLTGGEFEADMTSITVTDLEGEYKDKLEGHLKSDDFFNSQAWPCGHRIHWQHPCILLLPWSKPSSPCSTPLQVPV